MRRIKFSPLVAFLSAAVCCLVVQFMAVEYHIGKATNVHWLNDITWCETWQMLANHAADAMVLLLPFVLLPARWRKWSWIVIWLVTIWCFAQLIYYPIYRDIMPFSSFALWRNVSGVVVHSTVGALSWGDLEVVIPPVLLYFLWRVKWKKGVENETLNWKRKSFASVIVLVTFIAVQLAVTLDQFHHDEEETSYCDYLYTQYGVIWSRHAYYFISNGFMPLVIHSAYTSLVDQSSLSDDEAILIDNFINESPDYNDNQFARQLADGSKPNMVLIVVESLNSWATSLEIDGRKVAPVLDSICRDTTAIVGLKMKAQVKNGRSSDGIFIYNTGLLPLITQTVAMTHYEATYPSLPQALEGYNTMYFCCDDPYLWNKNRMADAYHYGRFSSALDLREQLDGKYQYIDSVLLSNALPAIKQLGTPFAAMITTTGMHTPYDETLVDPTWISRSEQYTPLVRNYLERVAFFDRQLGRFINDLKSSGLYDNTVIVIASDHNEFIDEVENGRPSIDPEGDNCAMIILNSGLPGRRIGNVFGQIDVYPTLLDIMGANTYQWKGLGRSLLREQVNTAAITPTEVAGDKRNVVAVKRQKLAWQVAHLIISSHYFNKEK